jgi:hypothetical protein
MYSNEIYIFQNSPVQPLPPPLPAAVQSPKCRPCFFVAVEMARVVAVAVVVVVAAVGVAVALAKQKQWWWQWWWRWR